MTKEESTEMGEQMEFPETFERFAKEYSFKDDKEVYTNGLDLIPIFRVEQWLEHDNKLRRIETDTAYECGKHAKLKELKAYKDARAEINQALYDDARGEQNDYERGRKSGIFLCESIISVKLGESRSENPNTCGDAISRAAAVDACLNGWNKDYKAIVEDIRRLPSVTPQQRTGRWIQKEEEGDAEPFIIWECSECHCVDEDGKPSYKYCPQCGAKMEVEE